MSGHKLITTPIRRAGLYGMSWTCECGNWRPLVADAPPGVRRAPQDVVVAYIKKTHAQHAAITAAGQADGSGTTGGDRE